MAVAALVIVFSCLAAATAHGAGTAVPARYLPGITASDFVSPLRADRFDCEGPSSAGARVLSLCMRGTPLASYQVQIWGRDAHRLTLVDASVMLSGRKAARQALSFLDSIAGIPLQRQQQASQAKRWINAALVRGRGSLQIGAIRLALTRKHLAYYLSIAPR